MSDTLPESNSRRLFLSHAAQAANAALIASRPAVPAIQRIAITSIASSLLGDSTPNKSPQTPSINPMQEMRTYAEIIFHRNKYGIQSPIGDLALSKFLSTIEPQKYPLSCEIAALTYLYRLYGKKISEDQIIDIIPTNEDPHLGIHPELKLGQRYSNPVSNQPPNPYGIFAKILAKKLNENKERLGIQALEARFRDTPFTHTDTFANFSRGLLSRNCFPIVWMVNTPSQDFDRIQNSGTWEYPPNEHAVLLTGISKSSDLGQGYAEIIDPLNPSIPYIYATEDLALRNEKCLSNMLWFEPANK